MAESPPIDLEILDSDDEDAVIMKSPPPNPAAPSPAPLKKMKKTTSVVWDDFKKLPIGLDGRSRAKCKWCGKTYGSESSNGTKNMLRHIPKCPRQGYICLTAHYVDENWKLKSIILNFCHMPPPHTGIALSEKIFKFLKDWGIEEKVFSITLDNAYNNDNMQDLLKAKLNLRNLLLCGGAFFHVRCGAHVLNLIVQEGLKVIDKSVSKIRETVKYIKGSEIRICKFEECAQQLGIRTAKGLRLDVTTRWNATYDMFESAMKYRRVFAHLEIEDANYKHCPSNDEWNRVERIARFLKPFYDITTLFSGTDYPTANLYFHGVSQIELLLLEEIESPDIFINDMAQRMKEKFDKYWDSYSVVLACAVVLDPRYKLDFVDYIFKKIESNDLTAKTKLQHVRTQLYQLFSEYEHQKPMVAENVSSCVGSSSHSSAPSGIDHEEDMEVDEFDYYESSVSGNTKKSQLDLYLEEPRLNRKQYAKLDVLSWWKQNDNRFSELSLMARDLLSIPITTVASESTFSIGSKILNQYRSCLLPENVEALICTRTWLCGFEAENANDITRQLEVQLSSMNISTVGSATNVD
uniref:BED-type domain-containing protein n=1 Tax=Fagus sylvatica TaxID=28930 RepID=A0A2N9GLN0_FAGSY